MKVLLADFDLFRSVGGGQTFYRGIILRHPHIDFYYFRKSEPEDAVRPDNAHPIEFEEPYNEPDIDGADLPPPRWTFAAFRMASNLAHSVAGRSFDVVDFPDYQQLGVFLGPALARHGVEFGRLALSMHGCISTTIALNWNTEGTTTIRQLEALQYAAVDTRYFISQLYGDEWRALSPLPSHYVDPMWFFSFPERRAYAANAEAPDLNFIGRAEKRKGPHLFLQLAWWLPRASFRHATIIGPEDVHFTGNTSTKQLKAMADLRSFDLRFHRCMTPTEMGVLFASKSVTVVPSQYDTLNLTALESLFCGCPTMIGSGAGACRYLRERFPELPFEEFDVRDLYANVPRLERILSDYDAYRGRLDSALDRIDLRPQGPGLEEAYATPPATDVAARVQLDQWYEQLHRQGAPYVRTARRPRLRLAV